MKKEGLLVVLLVVMASSFAFGEWKLGGMGQRGTEPDGFRGIKWGTDISTLSGMEYVETLIGIKEFRIYKKKNDKLKIGGANLEKIKYGFWRGKFCSINIYTEGYSNWLDLKEFIFEKFGQGCPVGEDGEIEDVWVWAGETIWMWLRYDKISKTGHLQMSSEKKGPPPKYWQGWEKVTMGILGFIVLCIFYLSFRTKGTSHNAHNTK